MYKLKLEYMNQNITKLNRDKSWNIQTNIIHNEIQSIEIKILF